MKSFLSLLLISKILHRLLTRFTAWHYADRLSQPARGNEQWRLVRVNVALNYRRRSYLRQLFLPALMIAATLPAFTGPPTQNPVIHAWQLRDFYTEKTEIEIDTMITAFQLHNPVFRRNISSSHLGNAGLAAMPDFFPERGLYSDFFFIDHFRAYLRHPSETEYYNTRRPFSLIDFSTGGPRTKNEKILSILHTQNVNPDFNIGFRYFNINSDGQYQNQRAVTNALSFFSSYDLGSYQFHANLNLNSARVFESGGLTDDASLYRIDFDTRDHAVRLMSARNGLTNASFFLSQSFNPFLFARNDTLPSADASWLQRFEIYHVLQYDQYRRTYDDSNPMSGFYPDVLISNRRTFDSLSYRSLTNKLMLELPEFSRGLVNFGAKAGIMNELIKGSHNIYPDTLFLFDNIEEEPLYYFFEKPSGFVITDRYQSSRGSNALIASARGGIGDVFGIWGRGSYFFQGYKAGEYDLHAGISFDLLQGKNQSIIEGSLRQKETTPSLFFKSFYSNHFAWNNNFRRIGESSLHGRISMPGRGFVASVDFNLVNNYIYFDHNARPAQHNDIIPVMSIAARKDIRLWKFHFRNTVNYQVSGNENILPLPAISLYQSTWFEQTLLSGMMTLQIGFDGRYTTAYYGYAYQPATSQFYLQNERKLGNYPYLDAFINVKHKRARLFFKTEHFNAGWLAPEYFSVLHYPGNHRVYKFGLSWTFYN
jgi:hypothetical protein